MRLIKFLKRRCLFLFLLAALALTFWGLYEHFCPPQPLHFWTAKDVATNTRRLLADNRTLAAVSIRDVAKEPGTFAPRPDGPLRFWDIMTGQEIRRVEVPKHSLATQQQYDQYLHLVASADRHWLAVEDSLGQISVFNVAAAQLRFTLQTTADQGWRSAIHRNFLFSPDSRLLAYEQPDGKAVILWDLATGKQTALLSGARRRFEFSPDGKTLATNTVDSTVLKLWDVATGKERAKLEGHTFPAG